MSDEGVHHLHQNEQEGYISPDTQRTLDNMGLKPNPAQPTEVRPQTEQAVTTLTTVHVGASSGPLETQSGRKISKRRPKKKASLPTKPVQSEEPEPFVPLLSQQDTDLGQVLKSRIAGAETHAVADKWLEVYSKYDALEETRRKNKFARSMTIAFGVSGLGFAIAAAVFSSWLLFLPGMFMIGIAGYFLAPDAVKEVFKNLSWKPK